MQNPKLIVIGIAGWSGNSPGQNFSIIQEEIEKIPGVLFFAPEYLDAKGFASKFRSHLTIEEYARKVEQFIVEIKDEYPEVPILIFGHSMGGLILRLLYNWGHRFSKMIFAGTPFQGFVLIPFDKKGVILRLLGRIFNVPCVIQMLPGSEFLMNLSAREGFTMKQRHFPPAMHIAGARDPIVDKRSIQPFGWESILEFVTIDSTHNMFPSAKDCRADNKIVSKSAIPVIIEEVRKILQSQ